MSRIDTLVCTDARKTKYRFVVLTMIFLVYAINYADRTNIGAVLPFIIDEFHINNFEAGAIASMFFLGYAVSQIPAGFFIAKRGTRGLVSLSIFGFSAFTWLMGTVSSVFGLKLVRLGLGLSEGPCPVGLASTINNWFPPKEKATATGVYIAATMFAPIIVPPLAVWIAVTWGGGGSFSLLLYPELWRPSRGICWSNPSLLRADLFPKANWQRLMPGVKVIIIAYAKIS